MLTMYPGMVNSPITELAAAIDETQTTIEVIDGTKLPDAPNLAIIGRGEDAETILYTEKTGNVLSGVTRGFQGIAKAWGQGARIARFFTEYDQRAMMQNIQENADNLAAHLNDKANPHNVTAEQIGAVKKSGDTMTGTLVNSALVAISHRRSSDKVWEFATSNGTVEADIRRVITSEPTRVEIRNAVSGMSLHLYDDGRLHYGSYVIWHAGNAGPFYRGTGSPEGVVTAPPGSLYQNLSGGQGTTLYYKATGTGNTGWRAVS